MGGHVHHLGMFINCHLELRLLAVSEHLTLACQRYKFVALYRCIFVFCIFFLVSCFLYLVSSYLLCVCSPTDGFYLHFALECAVTPLLFTSTALRRFIFVFISSADSRYIAGYSVHMAYIQHIHIHRYIDMNECLCVFAAICSFQSYRCSG